MHIFVDESGDVGFKFGQGSSRYYVLTLLVVTDLEEVEAAFIRSKLDIGILPTHEVKFTHTDAAYCERVLSSLNLPEVSSLTVVWDKTAMHPVTDAQRFQQDRLVDAMRLLQPVPRSAVLTIDESAKGAGWKRDVTTHIRQQLNTPEHRMVGATRFQPSSRTVLLQAADMICGAISSDTRRGVHRFQTTMSSRRHRVVIIRDT